MLGVGGGCDEDGVISVGASAPFASSETGRSFPCDACESTTVVGVGVGCDEDGVMPVGASGPSAFLFFLLSLLFWLVPLGLSFPTFPSRWLTGPDRGVLGGEVMELMADECNGIEEEEGE